MHQQLHEREADQVARLEPQHAQQRQHVERVDQVRQRFGGVVDLHCPAQVVLQVVGHQHHVGRLDDPLATARGDEEAQHRRIHAHQHGIGVMGGDLGEEQRDVVGQGLLVDPLHLGEDGGDRAVQRELDQHPGGGRHRTRHGVEEAAWAPVQQGTEHDEQQVVGIEPGDCSNGRFGGELLVQPAAGQCHHQQDQDRAVFQPFTRASALGCGRRGKAGVDAAVFGTARTVRAGCGRVGDHQRDDDQRGQQHPGLPEEDGLGERDHAGYRQNGRRQAGRVGLQLRR
ncbi:hypothetical protein D3C78_878190 [compost metagenome]